MTRIAITGIGVVAPGAIGVDAFSDLLDGGQTAATKIDRFDTNGLSAHTAAVVRDFVPRDFIAPMKLRRMNNLSRFGVAAARLAMNDRGSELTTAAGVAMGTAFGPVQTSVDYMQEYVEKGAALAPPQLFAESVANAPGSHVGIEFGLRGFNITVTQRESSALAALMYACSQIAKGVLPAAVVGGVVEVSEIVFGVLDRVGTLAQRNGGRRRRCRSDRGSCAAKTTIRVRVGIRHRARHHRDHLGLGLRRRSREQCNARRCRRC